jgi:hypothetical protein
MSLNPMALVPGGLPQQFGAGVTATEALVKALSHTHEKPLSIQVGPPSYDPDTHTLFLPGLPTEDVPAETLTLLRAYVSTKAAQRGHSTFTGTEPDYRDAPGLKHFVRSITQVRADTLVGDEFPGTWFNVQAALRADYKELTARNAREPVRPTMHLLGTLARYLLTRSATPDELRHEFPDAARYIDRLVDHLDSLDLRADETRLTRQALALARIIMADDEPEEPPPSRACQGQKGQGSGNRVQGSGTPRGGGTQTNPPNPGGSNTASSQVPPPPQPPQQDQAQPEASKAPPSQSQPKPTPLPDTAPTDHDAEQKMLEQLVNQIMQGGKGSPLQTSGPVRTYTYDPRQDQIELVTPHARKRPPWLSASYQHTAQGLEIRLRRILTTPSLLMRRRLVRGEVDERDLHRLVMGEEDVFRKRRRIEGLKVAVSVSWDESGSMSSVIRELTRMVFTLNHALGRLGVATEFLGWTTGNGDVKARVYRQCTMLHRIYKRFDDPYNHAQTLGRLSAIQATGATPTAEGLQFAAERLARRSEHRKVLFFLTDGQPELPAKGPHWVHYDYIRTIQQRAARAGIEVITLGVCAHDTHKLFQHFVTVTNPDHLRTTTGELLARTLDQTRRSLLRALG